MSTIIATEVHDRLPELLERAEQGETITITREGRPVAQLVPAPVIENEQTEEERRAKVATAITGMLAWRKLHGPKLGKDLTIRQMIEEGRRF